jgi:hypothetical protein
VTQAVEVPIYTRALRGRWTVAFAASLITHPVVWFGFPAWCQSLGYVREVLLAEAFAVAVEALWLRLWGVRRSVWWSLGANAASVAVGLTSRALFGWP